jgi:hypothetical protein
MSTRNVTEATLAAYLKVKGFKEIAQPKLFKNSVTFFFEDSPQLTKEIEAFFGHETLAEPLAMAESIRLTKSLIVDMRRNQKSGGGE